MIEKIWLLLDSRNPGGIESHVLQLADGLIRHRQEVEVVFLTNYGEHPLRNELRRRNIPTRSLDGRLRTLWKTMHQARPTLVHTHGYKAGLYGRLAAWLSGTPAVSTYHAGEIASGRVALYDWLDRASARLAAKVFAVSPQIAERLPVSAETFDNFINTDGLTDSRGEQIAFVGRLSREKGPDRFVQLAKRFPQQSFHIYGDGPMASALKNTASGNVHFHGQQSDMNRIWPRIGLLVMPSRHEGLPMAALEAMARGIPLLAYRVGALDRLIEDNRGGWLASPGNSTELAQGLTWWLGMENGNRKEIRRSARQKISQRFSSRIAIPRLIQHYYQIARSSMA